MAVIDSHCHLDAPRFDGDRALVLERAFLAGVKGLLVPAIGPAGWEPLLELPLSEPRVQVGLGIHPQLLPELPAEEDDAHLARLDELLGRGVAIAVGECGLDGGSAPLAPMDRQLRVLRAHFALARKHRLPLLVHCLRAHQELVDLLRDEAMPDTGLLLHSYSGGAELARFYAERGCHFSFAGPVTFEKARKPLEAVRAVPEDRLLVETDAPDQAPHPHRGGRCEPAMLPLIVEALARARGVPATELGELLTANTRRLFPAFRSWS